MTLSTGTRLGTYEVLAKLGEGGMGEVYRARDTKLNRDVALKVLPEAFTLDPDRLARFKREAQVLASLNHPNIGAIYGLEESAEVQALVLELVDGPTLADRIAQGPLALDEALPIARQVAEALEAAHEQGIVHRDLKPANVKVRDDGTVKVLDFGLAKFGAGGAGEAAGAGGTLGDSPTITSPVLATSVGVILGTAAYMSPEQAKGRPADKRSDVWAFGALLYEMLAGHRPFEGEDISDTLAAVLRGEPDWSALPPDVPEHIRLLLRRCLERDRNRRVSDVAVARFLISEPLAHPATTSALAQSMPRPPAWRRAVPSIASALAAAAATAVIVWLLRPPPASQGVVRFTYDLAADVRFSSRPALSISPDGTRIAFVANRRLFIKSLSEAEAAPVRGAESQTGKASISTPVFSPDGQSVAFWDVNEVKKIGIAGGAPMTIAKGVDNPFGMSWSGDSLLIGAGPEGILRVPASGGSPEVLIPSRENELVYGPQLLPDGRSVVFTVASGEQDWDNAQIVVQTIGSSDRKTIVQGGSDGRYLPTGHLVYALGGVLHALPFNANTLETVGVPRAVVEGVARARANSTGASHLTISANGSLAYAPGPAIGDAGVMDLVIADRKGSVRPLKLAPQIYIAPRFSPNGRQIAVGVEDPKNANIWVYDVSGTSEIRQLTFSGKDRFPVWSADGTRVAFRSELEGNPAIFWQPADGSAPAERLTTPSPGESHTPQEWFANGERLLYSIQTAKGHSIWTYALRNRRATRFIEDEFSSLPHVAVSRDGQWVAYGSADKQLNGVVFVQPFPATGAKYRVGNGVNPFWGPDGQSLFFATVGTPNFSVVSVTTRPSFAVRQSALIPRPLPVGVGPDVPRKYDIAPDGEHFVIVVRSEEAIGGRTRINVVLNWFDELKQLVPVARN